MKLVFRAAAIAAVTFCAGALADAATLDQSMLQPRPGNQAGKPDPEITPLAHEAVGHDGDEAIVAAPEFASLSDAVAAQDVSAEADRELDCLAIGVYYEAKGEPLAGQLAVADVILDRAASGRFPHTVCSVLTQPGQFSFVRRGRLPRPPANAAWRKAMAVAQVAKKELWDSPVDGALFFHARYVRPGWKRARVGTVGNHIFYR